MTNQYPGLARGPIDHNASSIINAIANAQIDMGSGLLLFDITNVNPTETLPRVREFDANDELVYGIAVGGDTDGIYGDGSASSNDRTRAASAGQGVVVVTQGRCLARVSAEDIQANDIQVDVGDALMAGGTVAGDGILIPAKLMGGGFFTNARIIAIALQPIPAGSVDMIAVDIQRSLLA